MTDSPHSRSMQNNTEQDSDSVSDSSPPQILIIGGGLPSIVFARLLNQSGFTPAIAPTMIPSDDNQIYSLSRSALRVLDKAGLRDQIENHSHSPARTHAHMLPTGESVRDSSRSNVSLITGNTVQSVIQRQRDSNDDISVLSRQISKIRPNKRSVIIQFDGGHTEAFDVVVSSQKAGLPGHSTRHTTGVHVWRFQIENGDNAQTHINEVWGHSRAAIHLNFSDRSHLTLISCENIESTQVVRAEMIRCHFHELIKRLSVQAEKLTDSSLEYSQIVMSIPRNLVNSLHARIASACHPASPAESIISSLGIEDACGLAEQIHTHQNNPKRALSSFEAARRSRQDSLSYQNKLDHHWSRHLNTLSPPIQFLCIRRHHHYQTNLPTE